MARACEALRQIAVLFQFGHEQQIIYTYPPTNEKYDCRRSQRHWFLAGQAEPVHPQVVGNALFVEQVRAGQVRAQGARGQLSEAGRTTR